ncbi:MAG: cation transporter [Ruminococcaceae bacterium]|nr:cation transporter [Oscillospiraceae bacterium]
MKTEKNMVLAFALNLAFSLLEFVGGIWTGSVAIVSDAIHDLGDALSIGFACLLEHKSKQQPDEDYTYGYGRFSVLGGAITTLILLAGSVIVILHAVERIVNPTPIHYNGMLVLAVFGVAVNFGAAWLTRDGDSLNQRAVNLHMMEDVLGWLVILIGAVVMRFTDCVLLDPILSIGTALFILLHALKNMRQVLELFLLKAPRDLCCADVKTHLLELEGVEDVHHLHLWSMDGNHHYATVHVVAEGDAHAIKEAVRQELAEHGIVHATLELETPGEHCHAKECRVETNHTHAHHHHHHHH